MGPPRRAAIIGGGAAGFFGAISLAESAPGIEIVLFEKGPQFLSKVRISGGGRCNVTHACFDIREMTQKYPRGERSLISPFHQFQASDTVDWFQKRGVQLKTESDGRMFPITDSSQTIIDCLQNEANRLGIKTFANKGVEEISKKGNEFHLNIGNRETAIASAVLIATGGCRTPALGKLAVSLGHTLEPPVPSLFTFHVQDAWVQSLAGLSMPSVEVEVPETGLRERGPLLFTHWGLSGPAILRTSAWGARELHQKNYQFTLRVNFNPDLPDQQARKEFQSRRVSNPARLVVNSALFQIPARLWEQLVANAGISRESRWSDFGKSAEHSLLQKLGRTELCVTGKSLNKDEFVTCGGVSLKEIDFKTMQSKICPGLYFAGEVLDVDGITGGFNFQAAWTTGWIAGRAMAGHSGKEND